MIELRQIFSSSGARPLVLLVALVPFLVTGRYPLHLLTTIAIMAMLALGLNLVFGFTGKLALASTGFFGLGAYGAAVLYVRLDVPFEIASLIALGLCLVTAVVVGYPTLRLGGFYFAVATLAWALVVESLLGSWSALTGGPSGLNLGSRPALLGFTLDDRMTSVLALVVAALVYLGMNRLVRSPVGRAFRAIRDGEDAAASLGIDTTYYKNVAFTIFAVVSGLAGIFQAYFAVFLNPAVFTLGLLFSILFIVVIGGIGSFDGTLIGVFVVVLIPEWLSFLSEYSTMTFAIIVVLVLLFLPDGLAGGLLKGWHRLRGRNVD